MADNERVQWEINDLPYGQLAPSQANRTEYYPGKATSQPGDLLGKEYRVPTSNAALDVAGPAEITRIRVAKLGRNTIADTEIREPEVTNTIVTSITDAEAGICGTHVLTETTTVEPAVAESFVEGDDEVAS